MNCYGLTETCITSTLYHDDRNIPLEQFSGVPLGRACPTVTTVILDDEVAPLPPGAAGELFIGGPGVAPDDVEQIWCEALGIASCTPTDDFLDLGGKSLSGMRIAARINERFDTGIGFQDVLDSRTLAALTDRVAELTGRA